MFIKRKSSNLFRKSIKLTLNKLNNADKKAVKKEVEEKPETVKKGKKITQNTELGESAQ